MEENKKLNNPQAFPIPQYADGEGRQGMTLRDYFAAVSIQGILSSQTEMRSNGAQNNQFSNQIELLVKEVYEIADEMLKQREL